MSQRIVELTSWRLKSKMSMLERFTEYAYTQNRSNIDIYDFNRHEVTSVIRCDIL